MIMKNSVIAYYEKMAFPEHEYESVQHYLNAKGCCYTTRVYKETGKYKAGKRYLAPWGDVLKIDEVKTYWKVSDRPFYEEMTEAERAEIRKYSEDMGLPYEFIRFSRAERIAFRKAERTDAELLVDIYNAAFYSDFVKYGACPAYGRTKEQMEASIVRYPKFIILSDGKPVGCVSCRETEEGVYEVGCLCVIPAYQGRGIGRQAVEFIQSYCENWQQFTLVTPVDKAENIRFYTEKCGFERVSEEMDGRVKVARFVLKRGDAEGA